VWLSEVDMMGAMVMSAANAQAGITSMNASRSAASGHRGHGGSPDLQKANHARTEYGSAVDMRVDYPRNNLDDPGINLRNNGRRVLTYADLRTVGGPLDSRDADREIELHLTGNMERFQWSIDGL